MVIMTSISLIICSFCVAYIMASPDVFIYLFVYESRTSVTWSSVVLLVVSVGSSNVFLGDRISS